MRKGRKPNSIIIKLYSFTDTVYHKGGERDRYTHTHRETVTDKERQTETKRQIKRESPESS